MVAWRRRIDWPIYAGVLMSVAVCGLAAPAHASFSVCNRSGEFLNVALSFESLLGLRTEGWWSIGPNQCADVIEGPVPVRYVYLHAQDAFGRGVLEGSVPICVSPTQFRTIGDVDCSADGMVEVAFSEIDIGDAVSWTVFLETGR
jgi:uncharacterized membrane protein